MNDASPTPTTSGASKLGLGIAAGIVGLPFVGLALAWLHPVALIDAPALDATRLIDATAASLALALVVTLVCLGLGSFFAWIQMRWLFAGAQWLTRLTLLTLVLPSFLVAACLREGFAPLGVLGEPLGLSGRFEGFWPAVLTLVLCCTPYVQLVVAAALRHLPAQQEEAAANLGASPRRVLREITLPMLRPALGFGALLVLVYAMADFGAVAVMDARVLTFELYQFAGRGGPQAPVIGLLLVLAIAPLIMLGRYLGGSEDQRTLSHNRHREPKAKTAPKWGQLIGYGTLLPYLFLGLVLPLSSVLHWALVMPKQGSVLTPLLTTAALGLVAASTALLLGGLPAALVAAARGRRKALEYGTFLASGIPGVLVAFGFLQLILHLPSDGLRSLAEGGLFLTLGLALRFASHSYGALKPGLLTQSHHAIDAARGLGASPWRIWRQIRVPHLAPSLAAGFLLSFVAVVKELPITLMLLPAGQTTLATRIFDAHEDAHLGDLGASAVALLAMVLVAQALLRRWSKA